MALLLTPLNFTWMVSTNPATAGWLRTLDIDASAIWWSLLALLAVPMVLGLTVTRRLPVLAERIRKPLANFSLLALLAFIVLGLVKERHLLTAQLLPQLMVVVLHNAAGLGLGWLAASAFRVAERDRRAITIEGGMQNSGLALGIIAVQFNMPTWAWSSSPACGASGTSSTGLRSRCWAPAAGPAIQTTAGPPRRG
jgi:BASS family bile acid:Na+ symporter